MEKNGIDMNITYANDKGLWEIPLTKEHYCSDLGYMQYNNVYTSAPVLPS